jgi:hypothetical protein
MIEVVVPRRTSGPKTHIIARSRESASSPQSTTAACCLETKSKSAFGVVRSLRAIRLRPLQTAISTEREVPAFETWSRSNLFRRDDIHQGNNDIHQGNKA